jgi:hypothetical protein
MDLLSNSIVNVYLNQKRFTMVYGMYVSLRLIQHFFFLLLLFFYYYQIELNFQLFRQFPNFNLPEYFYLCGFYIDLNVAGQPRIQYGKAV